MPKIYMKCNHGIAYEVTEHEAGYRDNYKHARGAPRFTIDGATHPKGEPIRFKSLKRLINYFADHRNVKLRRSG